MPQFIIFILGTVCVYIGGAVISASGNIAEWSENLRIGCVIFWGIVGVFSVCAYADANKKETEYYD